MIPQPFPEQPDTGPTVADMIAVTQGAAIAAVLPQFRLEMEAAIRTVQNQVFQAIKDKTLTDDMARMAWLEVYSHSNALRRLETRAKMGASIGETLTGMEIGAQNG